MNHWNPKSSLELAIDQISIVFPRPRSIEPVTRADFAVLGKSLAQSIPTDLQRFYFECYWDGMIPVPPSTDDDDYAAPVLSIYPPSELRRWGDRNELTDRKYWPELWKPCAFIAFAENCFGDDFLYCLSDGPLGVGTILMTDHEADEQIHVVGECLADWLSRLAAYRGVDYVVVPGDVTSLPSAERAAFEQDHRRLNPDSSFFRAKKPKTPVGGGSGSGTEPPKPMTPNQIARAQFKALDRDTQYVVAFYSMLLVFFGSKPCDLKRKLAPLISEMVNCYLKNRPLPRSNFESWDRMTETRVFVHIVASDADRSLVQMLTGAKYLAESMCEPDKTVGSTVLSLGAIAQREGVESYVILQRHIEIVVDEIKAVGDDEIGKSTRTALRRLIKRIDPRLRAKD